MTEPATGSVAASIAVATSAGGVGVLSALNSIPTAEFIPGTILAMLGAFSWKFISAGVAREKAAANGTPKNQYPTIDWTGVGYSMLGAPLAAGAVIAMVHIFKGQADWISLPGFIFAGPLAPVLVTRIVSMMTNLIPGGK